MTDYIILRARKGENPDTWEMIPGTVQSSSAKRALASASVSEGDYVAVPARSWNPLTVKVEQTTKITIG